MKVNDMLGLILSLFMSSIEMYNTAVKSCRPILINCLRTDGHCTRRKSSNLFQFNPYEKPEDQWTCKR